MAGDQDAPAAPEVGVYGHGGGYLHAIAPAPASTPSQSAPAALPPRAEILGIPLAVSDYEQVIDWMAATIAADGRVSITAAAVNLVMSAHEDPATMARGDGDAPWPSPMGSRWCGP